MEEDKFKDLTEFHLDGFDSRVVELAMNRFKNKETFFANLYDSVKGRTQAFKEVSEKQRSEKLQSLNPEQLDNLSRSHFKEHSTLFETLFNFLEDKKIKLLTGKYKGREATISNIIQCNYSGELLILPRILSKRDGSVLNTPEARRYRGIREVEFL